MGNILIVGKSNTAVEVICKRLLKEGNRVYLLSPGTTDVSPVGVKKYNYSYDSSSVYEIFGSCRPSTVIVMGAYDTLYQWGTRNDARTYQQYTAGLSNILVVSESVGVQRLIYISSGEVFEEDHLKEVSEHIKPSPKSHQAKAIAMGEMMVSYYSENMMLDGIIARFDQLYFCPKNTEECNNFYASVCRSAVVNGKITINSKISRSAIWINDAAQALHLLITTPLHDHSIYHITSQEVMAGWELAKYIQNNSTREILIEDNAANTQQLIRLKDSYFAEEFGFSPHYSLEDGILRILQYMQKHIQRFQKEGHGTGDKKGTQKFFRKVIPFLEAIACFFLVFYLQGTYGQSEIFRNLDLFLLYILLFSLIYGSRLSVFTDVLSMIGYLILRGQTSTPLELLIDVGTYIWIAKIFIVGMSVGHQRDLLRTLRIDKDEEIDYINSRLDDIAEINSSTTSIKDYFENQIINNQESLSYFYDILTTLDAAEDEGLLFEVVNVLKTSMNTQCVAIYRASGNGYYRLLTSTPSVRDGIGRSVKEADYPLIFDSIENDHVYINKSADASIPSMVGCTLDENNQIQMLLCLWNIPFDEMTLHNRNRFRILCLIIRGALIRASKYLDALTAQRYLPDSHILTKDAFLNMERIYRNAADRKLVRYLMLKIIPNVEDAEAQKLLGTLLREVDIIGSFGNSVYYAMVLFSGTDDAGIFLNRLRKHGLEAALVPEVLPRDR